MAKVAEDIFFEGNLIAAVILGETKEERYNALKVLLAQQETLFKEHAEGINALDISDENVSNPPTLSEINNIFGEPGHKEEQAKN